MKATLALAALFATAITNAQQVFGDETRAWMVGPAKAVSSGQVVTFQYSATGSKIVFSRLDSNSVFRGITDEPAVPEWFVYDVATSSTTPIRVKGLSRGAEIAVMGDNMHVFFQDSANPAIQGFYNLDNGTIWPTKIVESGISYLGDQPQAPFVLAKVSDKEFSLLAPGKPPQPLKVSPELYLYTPYRYDNDTIKFLGTTTESGPERFKEATFERRNGEVKFRTLPKDDWMSLWRGFSVPVFALSSDDSMAKLGLPEIAPKAKAPKQAGAKVSYLEPSTKICPASYTLALDDKGKTLAYIDNGALLLREIRPFDHDLAEKMKIAALKTEALSKAKQVGTAILIYAADMDDVLPNGDNFVNRLMPYLKDRKSLDQFNYSFAGGNAANIDKPAETELGFILGPGGRAVVYADGHARWIQDKI